MNDPGDRKSTIDFTGMPGRSFGPPGIEQIHSGRIAVYFVVIGTHKPGAAQARSDLEDTFVAYLRDHPDHPGVTLHNGGPTLAEDGESIVGLVLVVEAPSREAAQASRWTAPSPGGTVRRLAGPALGLENRPPWIGFRSGRIQSPTPPLRQVRRSARSPD